MFGCVERRIHLRVAASGFVHFAQAFFFSKCVFILFLFAFCALLLYFICEYHFSFRARSVVVQIGGQTLIFAEADLKYRMGRKCYILSLLI